VSGYRVTVGRLAPDELLDREDELACLATFCHGDQPYWWWQAGPWSGKTGLLAWFALHPPDDIDAVCFFIRAAIDTENSLPAYLSIVLPQLALLTGDQLPADLAGPDPMNIYQDLLARAAQHAQDRGRRLALIIDGLDEDKGSPSIVSQLPNHPHPALRIILASRATPDVLSDIKDDHPLHNWTKTALNPSPHARGIGQQAEAELQRLLTGKNKKVHRRLVGFITVARGGLTIKDLAALSDQPQSEVKTFLASEAGRSLTPHTLATTFTFLDAPEDVGYVLAHLELSRLAVEELGPQLADYRDKIHAWAQQYGADRWPPMTPTYLLLEYPALLQQLHDSGRLYALATDTSRRDRLFERTGGDAAALNEIAITLTFLVDQAEPDLANICLLARQHDLLISRNEQIPDELLSAWVHLGHVNRAYAAAQSKPARVRFEALTVIAEAVAQTGDINRAIQIADMFSDDRRAEMLSAIAKVAARNGDRCRAIELTDRAEAIANAITPDNRKFQQLAAVAAARAWAGDIDRAETLAQALTADFRRAIMLMAMPSLGGALSAISEGVAHAGGIDRAEAIADTIPDDDEHARALAAIAKIAAEANEIERATELSDRAEAIANNAAASDYSKAQALAAVAAAIARTGDLDRATKLAGTITEPWASSEAHSAIAEAVAQSGNIDRATKLAGTITERWAQDKALGAIAEIVAQRGDIDRAEAIANTITDDYSYSRARKLSVLAQITARRGDFERAEQLARSATERLNRLVDAYHKWEALSAIAKGLAEAGDADRAETLAQSITDDSLRGEADYFRGRASSAIAEAVAETRDFDGAEAIADTIVDKDDHAHALAAIAKIAAEAHQIERAIKIADRAEAIANTISNADDKSQALGVVAAAIARAGDFDRAIRLTDRVEAVASASSAELSKSEALAAVAAAIARTGELNRAIELINTITNFWIWSEALIPIAEGVAETGNRDRTIELADGAEAIANAITEEFYISRAQAAVAAAWGWAGDAGRAEAIAGTITDDADHALALAAIARVEAKAGRIERAVQFTDRARSLVPDGLSSTVEAHFASVAEALARAGCPDRVEDIARATLSATSLEKVAKQLAANGHHQAAVRVLARAWMFVTWGDPLQALVTVDRSAAHRVMGDISNNL